MDEKERKQITDANDEQARQWFESSDFAGTKLDTGSGKKGKKADWKFTKQDLTVLCEVKTIFSGGQSGFTQEQSERRRLERKQKFDRFRDEAIADGTTLLTHKDEQDYLEGKTPYVKQNIRKEEEFNNFQDSIRYELENDTRVGKLPFSMSISVNGLYVAYGDEREQFMNWLRGYVLWANQASGHNHSSYTFTFIPARRAENGSLQHAVEAFVQMRGPYESSNPQLEISFIYGGVPFNEQRIFEEIDEAIGQLRNSISEATTPDILSVVAFWSASDFLKFPMLLRMDATEEQLGNVPKRYYLFDWAFSDYPDLAAIILFWFGFEGEIPQVSKIFPVGAVITNPHLPQAETILKNAISEKCIFITGIASDPLNPS